MTTAINITGAKAINSVVTAIAPAIDLTANSPNSTKTTATAALTSTDKRLTAVLIFFKVGYFKLPVAVCCNNPHP